VSSYSGKKKGKINLKWHKEIKIFMIHFVGNNLLPRK